MTLISPLMLKKYGIPFDKVSGLRTQRSLAYMETTLSGVFHRELYSTCSSVPGVGQD